MKPLLTGAIVLTVICLFLRSVQANAPTVQSDRAIASSATSSEPIYFEPMEQVDEMTPEEAQEILDRHESCESDACRSGHLEGSPSPDEVEEAQRVLEQQRQRQRQQ